MQKIGFCDRYGLTKAVLNGTIFDRQQAEEDMERAYWEAQQQAEYEAEMRAYEEAYHQAEYEYYWMLFMEENEMITD